VSLRRTEDPDSFTAKRVAQPTEQHHPEKRRDQRDAADQTT
jgi:hypothetical protein